VVREKKLVEQVNCQQPDNKEYTICASVRLPGKKKDSHSHPPVRPAGADEQAVCGSIDTLFPGMCVLTQCAGSAPQHGLLRTALEGCVEHAPGHRFLCRFAARNFSGLQMKLSHVGHYSAGMTVLFVD
jgi:hypothetical protein